MAAMRGTGPDRGTAHAKLTMTPSPSVFLYCNLISLQTPVWPMNADFKLECIFNYFYMNFDYLFISAKKNYTQLTVKKIPF